MVYMVYIWCTWCTWFVYKSDMSDVSDVCECDGQTCQNHQSAFAVDDDRVGVATKKVFALNSLTCCQKTHTPAEKQTKTTIFTNHFSCHQISVCENAERSS